MATRGKPKKRKPTITATKAVPVQIQAQSAPLPPAPEPPKRRKVNHIGVLFDRSGSMRPIVEAARKAANAIITAIKTSSAREAIETKVSTWFFDSDREVFTNAPKLHIIQENVHAALVNELDLYTIGSGTVLAGAFLSAANRLLSHPIDDPNTDHNYLLQIVTDGEDVHSTPLERIAWPAKIKELVERGNWSVVFSGPAGCRKIMSYFGIPEGNIVEWEATKAGVEELGRHTALAYDSYATNTSLGTQKSMKAANTKFYATVNVGFTAEEMREKLDDLTPVTKAWLAPKEMEAKELVEAHGRTYFIGSCYYPLTHTERKVQADKQIIIEEKGTKRFYGGPRARALVGLPDGKDAVVEVGNLQNFNVYVQTRSINRKIPRGLLCVQRTDQTVDLQPTWDHVKAAEEAAKKLAANIAKTQPSIREAVPGQKYDWVQIANEQVVQTFSHAELIKEFQTPPTS